MPMKTKICCKCTYHFAIPLFVCLYICTLYNFEENSMNVQTENPHLKIDISEIDTQGERNFFSGFIRKSWRSRL